jgi:uncharacterized protein (DUF2252 family)
LDASDDRTPDEQRAHGAALRNKVPFASHAVWVAPADRIDPVDLLRQQGESRLQQLLSLRYERMLVSAFTFYRGGALIMASDLSNTLSTGIRVQACGDAHIANFGMFSSPERRTVFDINDFDETARGPWEWDVKRLAASVEICGRDRAFDAKDRKEAVLGCVRGYCNGIAEFANMGNLDVWYAHTDIDHLIKHFSEQMPDNNPERAQQVLGKVKSKDNARAIAKLTEVVDGRLRIVSAPPLVIPMRDMVTRKFDVGDIDIAETAVHLRKAFFEYLRTLSPDKRHLINQYRGVDVALKVVGVGSVGTRCLIIVMEGAGREDPLVLQIKEAEESVLERFCGKDVFTEHGQRVVEGQHAIQAASDMLLGWCQLSGEDGLTRDYYVRQLWDGKASIDLAKISVEGLKLLSETCGRTLAHAHARTGNRFEIAGYLGDGIEFSKAVAKFARAYANQNEADYARFMEALESGELSVADPSQDAW